DKVNLAEGELQDALSFMKMPGSLKRFERPLQPSGPDGRSGISAIIADMAEPSRAVREAASSVQMQERNNPLSEMRARVESQRIGASEEIAELRHLLDEEQRASDQALSEYASEPLFVSYQPSSRAAAFYREQISENQKKLDDAAALDNSIHNDYKTAVAPWLVTLQNGADGVIGATIENLKEVKFEDAANPQGAAGESLVDIDQDQPVGLAGHVQTIKDIYEQLLDLRKIRRTTLAELKSATQDEDISGLLIKTTSVKDLQPLFARELKKYEAYTQRLQAVTAKQGQLVKRISEEFRCLMELPQARAINDKWDMAESRKATVEAQVLEAAQVYRHVSDGLDKANRFYTLLLDSLGPFGRQVKEFVASRANQREQLIKQISQDVAARQQAALKERLSQYSAPLQPQQQPQPQQQRTYQPAMQNTYSPQQGPTHSPSVHSTQAFDMGQLANQTAQMSLHSPTNVPASLPATHHQQQQQPQLQQLQQPMYSPNGASAPQYTPSAPVQPHNSYMQQQQPQQQLYNGQQPMQQSIAQYGHAQIVAPEVSTDPYSAAVRRSTSIEASSLTNPVSTSYKPGYGGYTTTAAPIQQPIPGAPVGGYGVSVSGPAATSASYAPAPQIPAYQQQPFYAGFSEAVPVSVVSAPILHSAVAPQQLSANSYAPPHFPPPQAQAQSQSQAQAHHFQQPLQHHQPQQQQPPASFGSTVASNAPQHPPQQPQYQTPPAQQIHQQQQQPSYVPITQPGGAQQPIHGQSSYQQQYSHIDGYAPQPAGQGNPGALAYSTAGTAQSLASGMPLVSMSYQQPSYFSPQQQQQQQQQQIQQYSAQQSVGYQQQTIPPQQQPPMSHGYGYQYAAPHQQQQQQPSHQGVGVTYGGPAQTSQLPPMQQMAPPAAVPSMGYSQQLQQPSYLPPPAQLQQAIPPLQPQPQQPPQQQPYHHGYGGNHGSLMD
ncbi:bck1-like resistance to osmotic shock, partial [Coemansia sp. RSA 2599]